MLKERERLQVKKNALAFFSSSLESLQAMDKQTWSHHIPQSLSYQVSAGDMCGNLLARFTQNCTDFHRLRRRIHHRLGTIGGMRSHFSWLRVGTLASHRIWLTFFHRFWLTWIFERDARNLAGAPGRTFRQWPSTRQKISNSTHRRVERRLQDCNRSRCPMANVNCHTHESRWYPARVANECLAYLPAQDFFFSNFCF